MTILGIDHVEFYVADLEKAAAALCRSFGFRTACTALAGPGDPGDAAAGSRSLLLRQGAIKLVLTAASSPSHAAANFVQRHGDGVASIAFRADDVRQEFAAAVAGGAAPIAAPELARREDRVAGEGLIAQAVVSGFGDVTHRLVERDGPARGRGAGAAPGRRAVRGPRPRRDLPPAR